jgi:5-deoxy-glucuronate isomerase
MSQWYYPKGSLRRGEWEAIVDDTLPGWRYTGMRLANSADASSFAIAPDGIERVIYMLSGVSTEVTYTVEGSTETVTLSGRTSVFHGAVDYLYLPINTDISFTTNGRVMVVEAVASVAKPVHLRRAADVPLLLRGAGKSTRQIHDFGGVEHLDADRMVAVEVVAPSGNWSGVPPHKHDTYLPGIESNLEEVYYFELAPDRAYTPFGEVDPIAYFRTYSGDDREMDELFEIRSGDIVLVPYGYHGPAAAMPGYDLYFMNVMAGPDPERAWNATDDPKHHWIRATWDQEVPDPRLPYQA